jgi:hypothetical protein
MGTLVSYAAERKLPLEQLFGDKNKLIPPFGNRRKGVGAGKGSVHSIVLFSQLPPPIP